MSCPWYYEHLVKIHGITLRIESCMSDQLTHRSLGWPSWLLLLLLLLLLLFFITYSRLVLRPTPLVVSLFFFLFHHLQPTDPTSNLACGHMTPPPLTLQEVRYLSYVLEQRGSNITCARRLLLLPVESVYPPILKPSISSRHQHNTHSLQVSMGLTAC